MAMRLPVGEPEAGPWRPASIDELLRLLVGAGGPVDGRPRIVAVDGRSAGGKTTLAARLHAAVPASAVVHTDDVAWHHSFFDWSELLADGVLAPLRRGEAVRYRPPGWEAKGRPGAIGVPAGLELVIVEGVGAGRRELTHLTDAIVWVQSDVAEAERRGIARDVAAGVDGDVVEITRFWHEWEAEELPFVDRERPWERATVVARGVTADASEPEGLWLAPRPSPTAG